MKLRLAFAAIALSLVALPQAQTPKAAGAPTIEQFLSRGLPARSDSAKKADRIAWLSYDEGKRNVYTAAAPAFTPVRLTSFLKDDGTDLTRSGSSDDGSTVVVFVRGHTPNRDGWVANPSSDPDGAERAIWAARTAAPGVAWRVAEGIGARARAGRQRPCCSSATARSIARRRDAGAARSSAIDRGEEPFIKAWGTNSSAALVAGRHEDRVRQPAGRSQLHRRLRRRDAHGEVHGARRRPRHESDVVAGRQAHRVHPPARVCRSASRRSRAAAASACRTGPRSIRRHAARTRRRAGARRRRPAGGGRRAAAAAAMPPSSAGGRPDARH